MTRENKAKAVQFPMDAKAYNVLKNRAKALEISTGQLVANLLGSLELRLKRAYRESKIEPGQVCMKSDKLMINVILKADETGDSDNWKAHPLQTGLINARQEILFDVATNMVWEPQIQLSNKDNKKQ